MRPIRDRIGVVGSGMPWTAKLTSVIWRPDAVASNGSVDPPPSQVKARVSPGAVVERSREI